MGIPILKIRRYHDHLIVNMRIPIPGKDGLYIDGGPGGIGMDKCSVELTLVSRNFVGRHKMISTYSSIMFYNWYGAGSRRTHFSCIVSTMAADVLVMQGHQVSAALFLWSSKSFTLPQPANHFFIKLNLLRVINTEISHACCSLCW